ncbi:hypothetical protein [Lysobacter sp. CA196]|uniref:hypothetical protein n=1 Tax=Lysobacter sp. CA196 TaxID=3455606 RepID=UPI003F8D82A2
MSARHHPADSERGPERPGADADGFLDRVVARTRQQGPLLIRRRPSLFEPRQPSGPAPEIVESILVAPAPAPMTALARPSAWPEEHARVESAAPKPTPGTATRATAPTPAFAVNAQPQASLAVPAAGSSAIGPPYRSHRLSDQDGPGSTMQRLPDARPNRNTPSDPMSGAVAAEPKPRSERNDHIEPIARIERIERIERPTRIEHLQPQPQTSIARAIGLHVHEPAVEPPQRLAAPAALPSPMPRRRDTAPVAPVANPGRAAAMALAPVTAPPAPIQVTIGRLEVGAVAPAAFAAAPATGPAREPKLGLDDYLRQRHGGRP